MEEGGWRRMEEGGWRREGGGGGGWRREGGGGWGREGGGGRVEEGEEKGRGWRREEGKVECIHVLNKLCYLAIYVCVREEWERETLRTRLTRSSLVSIVDIKVFYLDVIHHRPLGVCFYHLAPDSLIGSRTFGQIL